MTGIEKNVLIQELLQELNIEYRDQGHEHCRPGWVQIDCPFCSPNWHHWRLGINVATKHTNCWCCGYKRLGQVLYAVREGNTHVAKVKELLKDIKVTVHRKEAKERGHLVLPTGLGDLEETHRRYLIKRGFNPDELIKTWGIRATNYQSNIPWRIWIPIVYKGELVTWSSRSISDKHEMRYINAAKNQEIYSKSDVLYGADLTNHTAIVVEGPFDVWKIGPGAVATMTTSYSRAQLSLLSKYSRVVVCFDKEKAAQQRAEKLLTELKVFGGEYYQVTLDSKDPGSATHEEIQTLRTRFLLN